MRPGRLIPFFFFAFATLWEATATPAQTVEEVFARHLEARGGGAALSKLRSLSVHGSLDVAGVEASMTVRSRRPDKLRLEVEVGGQKDIRAYDGSMGWAVMATRGQPEPRALSGEDLALLRRQADFDGPLVDSAAKGHRVELLGRGGGGPGDSGADARLIRLRITHADGSMMTSFLDPVTWLEVRQEFVLQIAGQPVDVILTFEDYRSVGGLMLAHTFTQTFVGHAVGTKFTAETVEFDVDLEEEAFQWPVSTEVADP